MSEITNQRLESYLSGTLADAEVHVSDLVEHVEGWSRDTASFVATWHENGQEHSRHLVVRAESDGQMGSKQGVDVATEFGIMDAAQSAEIPVPKTYWHESDDSILGGEFFLMDHANGEAPVTWEDSDRQELYSAWDDPARSLPNQFVDIVAGVHSLNPEDVPLDSVSSDEVVERELNRWEAIYRSMALKDEPAINEALRWFHNNKPDVPETTVVHGDYRIGNALIEDDEITAILDWELARIGDPLYDLGYASTKYYAGKLVEPIERPELACALLEREWFYDEYEKRTGREVDRERVRYWQAFSAFNMLTIAMAGVFMYNEGETSDVRNAWYQYVLPGLIEDILDAVRSDRI